MLIIYPILFARRNSLNRSVHEIHLRIKDNDRRRIEDAPTPSQYADDVKWQDNQKGNYILDSLNGIG